MRATGLLLLVFLFLLSFAQFVPAANRPLLKSPSTVLKIHKFTDFLITPKRLKNLLSKRSKIIFVDIRPRSEFERVRIPGSLHMEIYTIKTKNFLKENDIIVVANGYRLAMLLGECSRLKNLGFKSIRVLYGGIQSWINSGGKVEGIDSYAPTKCIFYDPLVLFEERELNDWIVLDLFRKKKKIHSLFPNWKVISLRYTKNPKRLKKRIGDKILRIRQPKGDFRRYLLFYDKSDVKKITSGICMKYPFFIYKGSVSDYESFLEKERRILKAKREVERKREKEGLRKPCGCGF